MKVYRKGPIELRCGDYREVLADVEPDAVICDAPYSVRTHEGERGLRDGGADPHRPGGARCPRNAIGYSSIDRAWCDVFADRWAPFPWVVVFGDNISAQWHREAAEAVGRVGFAPLPVIKANPAPRFAGDGPASVAEYLAVSRLRSRAVFRGSLPGWYRALTQTGRVGKASGIVGSKDLALMRALVRDYSRPGDLVCDPCAGGATTLIAAALEGRRAIGAELDPDTFEKACARIERTALTPPLRGLDIEAVKMEQTGLGFGEGDDE